MILTEEQARTKWCPMARYGELHGPEQGAAAALSYNRADVPNAPPIPSTCRCIASDCMMWRWKLVGGGYDVKRNKADEKVGFCGMSSK